MKTKNSCIAVYNTCEEAEKAVTELDHAGFDMTKLSIVGKDQEKEQRVLGYYNMSDRVKFWGKRGALWGAYGESCLVQFLFVSLLQA